MKTIKLADKKNSAVEMVKDALAAAKKYEEYHMFVSLQGEQALERAAEIDAQIARGESVGRLAGVPFVIKDNMSTRVGATTASSHMLEPYDAPITATCVKRLVDEGAIVIGRTNLDSFAHGGSTENSYFGPTLNSRDKKRVSGGSSGGSAVSVALGVVPFALGSDTGGSIRQPASFNGVYGIKPTYGTVSRYGVVPMASSTDTIGCFASTAGDVDLVMSILSGRDEKDMTTLDDFWTAPAKKTKKIGVIRDLMTEDVDAEVRENVNKYIKKLEKAGYEIGEISMPMLKYSLAVYYIVTPAEIASNLSRHDGIRYGLRSKKSGTLNELYGRTRDEGFMDENKRRIMVGNFVLSSGFFDAYYLKAQKARTLLIQSYNDAFKQYDVLVCPVAPTPAFKLGENTDDPMKMYLADALTVAPSMAGLPALAVPAGETKSGLTVGAQLIGPRRSDAELVRLAGELE